MAHRVIWLTGQYRSRVILCTYASAGGCAYGCKCTCALDVFMSVYVGVCMVHRVT